VSPRLLLTVGTSTACLRTHSALAGQQATGSDDRQSCPTRNRLRCPSQLSDAAQPSSTCAGAGHASEHPQRGCSKLGAAKGCSEASGRRGQRCQQREHCLGGARRLGSSCARTQGCLPACPNSAAFPRASFQQKQTLPCATPVAARAASLKLARAKPTTVSARGTG